MFRKVSNDFGTSNKKTCMAAQQADKVYKVRNCSLTSSNSSTSDRKRLFLRLTPNYQKLMLQKFAEVFGKCGKFLSLGWFFHIYPDDSDAYKQKKKQLPSLSTICYDSLVKIFQFLSVQDLLTNVHVVNKAFSSTLLEHKERWVWLNLIGIEKI